MAQQERVPGWELRWLQNLHKETHKCYTTCYSANPAKSLEFGADGYAASLTDWHELLQITSPDSVCGIVYVRGDFPDNPESILARSQWQDDGGNKGTFGLQIEPGGSFLQRGDRLAHGLINFRWPYSQYELREGGGNLIGGVGNASTCDAISWVKDGTLFQALRFSYAEQNNAKFVQIRVGGKVFFGCPCSNGSSVERKEWEKKEPDKKTPERTSSAKAASTIRTSGSDSVPGRAKIFCCSGHYQKRLEVQVFVDGEQYLFNDSSMGESNVSHYLPVGLDRARTIVATYTVVDMVDQELPATDKWGNVSLYTKTAFEGVELALGIADEKNSVEMVDRLWTACVPQNYSEMQAREFCALARCVEQILGVASIPVYAQPDRFGVALVNNIITVQHVDLQSTFWQLRYLVKAHNYIAGRKFGKELIPLETSLDDIRNSYLQKIRNRLRHTLIWVLKANNQKGQLLLPISEGYNKDHNENTRSCWALRNTMSRDISYNQAYFQSLAVWYVMKHCREAVTTDFLTTILLPELKKLATNEEERTKYSEDRSTRKSDILQWFRFRCLDLICKTTFEEDERSTSLYQIQELKGLKDIIDRSEAEAQKYVLRFQESRQGLDPVADEEVDRLYLLADELFDFPEPVKDEPAKDLAQARSLEAKERIESRVSTSQFNPGPESWDTPSQPQPNPPWELSCLNHHSDLRVGVWSKEDLPDLIERRNNVFQFILSDHTFMTSWDRADSSLIGKWWNMEPASVICATLVDLKDQGKLGTVEPISRRGTGLSEGQPAKADQQSPLNLNTRSHNSPRRSVHWLVYKPFQCYHAKWQIQSVGLFEPETNDISTRGKLSRYLREKAAYQAASRDTSKETIAKLIGEITPKDVKHLYAFHLSSPNDCELIKLAESKSGPPAKTCFTHSWIKMKLSVVDLGAKHRILFAQRCSPAMVKGVVNLWHSDALDSLNTYFGNTSRFRDDVETMWTTSITIAHWNIGRFDSFPSSPSEDEHFDEGSNRKHDAFPPLSILSRAEKRKVNRLGNRKVTLEQRSLSLIITGDSSGYFWTCSFWCAITDVESVKKLVQISQSKLQLFIHQPASGRSIVFMIMLGHVCVVLTTRYRTILNDLDTILELGEHILFEGLNWKAEDAVEKLKKYLWGLESVRILEDHLESTMAQIERARQSLERMIKQEIPRYQKDLVKEYSDVLKAFEDQYNLLTGVKTRFKNKIIQLTALRDGISLVTNVEDTRTTIKQGNNIRMLTLITIAYLPLSYVTSLFTVSKWSLPSHDGISLYFRYLFPFLVVTFIIAFSLDFLIRKAMILDPIPKRVKKKAAEIGVLIRLEVTRRFRKDLREDLPIELAQPQRRDTGFDL